jgi:hypothetical protein
VRQLGQLQDRGAASTSVHRYVHFGQIVAKGIKRVALRSSDENLVQKRAHELEDGDAVLPRCVGVCLVARLRRSAPGAFNPRPTSVIRLSAGRSRIRHRAPCGYYRVAAENRAQARYVDIDGAIDRVVDALARAEIER